MSDVLLRQPSKDAELDDVLHCAGRIQDCLVMWGMEFLEFSTQILVNPDPSAIHHFQVCSFILPGDHIPVPKMDLCFLQLHISDVCSIRVKDFADQRRVRQTRGVSE